MDLNECLERFKPPNYLLCPVCLEVFTHPKLLPCSHTLCGRCVTGLLEHTPPGTVTRHGVEPNLHVACPVCRGNLAKTQVDSLPTNRALEEAVADWQRRTDRERLVWIKGCISRCDNHDQNANLWCSLCKTNVCPDCCAEPSTSESDHQRHPMQEFEDFCEKRSRLINEYLISKPRLIEIGEALRHTTKLQSEVMENYLSFVKDVADLQSSIGDTLELKIVGVLADTNLKLKSLYNEQRELHTKLVESIERHTRCFTSTFDPSACVTLADLQQSREKLEQECDHACGEGQKELHQAHLDLRRSLALSLHKIARVKDMLTAMEFIPRPFSAPSQTSHTTSSANRTPNTSILTQPQPIPVRNTASFSPTVLTTTALLRAGFLRILPDGSVQYTNVPNAQSNPTDRSSTAVQAALSHLPQGTPVRFIQGALRPGNLQTNNFRPRSPRPPTTPAIFSNVTFPRFAPASSLVRAPGAFHNPGSSNSSHSMTSGPSYQQHTVQQQTVRGGQRGIIGAGPVMPSPQHVYAHDQSPGLFRALANQFTGWSQQPAPAGYVRIASPGLNQTDQHGGRAAVLSPPARIVRFVPDQSQSSTAMSPPVSPPLDHAYHVAPAPVVSSGRRGTSANAETVSSSSESHRRPRSSPRTRSRNGGGGNSRERSRNSRSRTNTNNNALFGDDDSNGSGASHDHDFPPILPELDPLGVGAMEVVQDIALDNSNLNPDDIPLDHNIEGNVLHDINGEQQTSARHGSRDFQLGLNMQNNSEMFVQDELPNLGQRFGGLPQYNYDSFGGLEMYNPPPVQRIIDNGSVFMDVSDNLNDENR